MASKKSSRNAMKKIDKQLDKLLKDKKEIEDIPIMNRKEFEKKAKESKNKTVKKTNTNTGYVKKKDRRSDAIVVEERKKKKTNSKKKEAIVVSERKVKPNKKKTIRKKEAPKKVQRQKKVGESTMRLQKLEEEIRTLYDKVEDVVDDIETTKEVDIIPDENIIITDIVVKDKEEVVEEEPYDKGGRILNIIALILFIIFLLLFLVFVGFIIFVCTY